MGVGAVCRCWPPRIEFSVYDSQTIGSNKETTKSIDVLYIRKRRNLEMFSRRVCLFADLTEVVDGYRHGHHRRDTGW